MSICSRFKTGEEAFEILLLPGGQAFAYARDEPGAFVTLVVLVSCVAENANMASTEDSVGTDYNFVAE